MLTQDMAITCAKYSGVILTKVSLCEECLQLKVKVNDKRNDITKNLVKVHL